MVDGVKTLIEQSLVEAAQKYKILIHAMEVDDDHVHPFVSLPFDMSVSKAFQLFKGRSSYAVFQVFPHLRSTLTKGHFWSPGKFCRSISNVKADTVRHYIEKHQFKELNQTIHAAREEIEQLRLSGFF